MNQTISEREQLEADRKWAREELRRAMLDKELRDVRTGLLLVFLVGGLCDYGLWELGKCVWHLIGGLR